MKTKKRAVSPIIAAVIMIGIVVAAGAVIFIVVLPMMSDTGVVVFEESAFKFVDTNGNDMYDQVEIALKNEATTDAEVTNIVISTSSDGSYWHNVNSSTINVPFTIGSGLAKIPKPTFIPDYTDFIYPGDVHYRVQATFTIGDSDPETITSPISIQNHTGLVATVDITTEYYNEITINGKFVDRGARDNQDQGDTYVNVIKLTIENNFAGPLSIDDTYGSYRTTGTWHGGLYVDDTDDNWVQTTSDQIYALAIRDGDFSKAWACPATSNNYDSGAAHMWSTILGQTSPATIAGVDNDAAQTIAVDETAVFYFIALGDYNDQYGPLVTGETGYLGLAFHSDINWGTRNYVRWNQTVSITA